MKKLFFIPIVILLAAVLAVSACAKPAPAPSPTPTPTPAPTPVKPITVKLGYDTPPPTSLGVPAEFFAKELTKRTEGRVTVETYPAGTLSTMESSLESLRAGIADAYVISLGANRDEFPVLSFTGIPGLDFFPDTDALMKLETDTLRNIVAKYPGAAEELEGLKILYSNTYTGAVLMGKGNPVRTPADIKGKKIGADAYRQDLVTNNGGAPVFTIPPFMYEQLQTGVIDNTMVAWMAAADWQLQELVKWVYDLTFGGGQLPCVMRTEVWNKISPADQQIVMQTAADAEQVNRDTLAKQIPEARQLWKATGIQVIIPTKAELALWEESFKVIWDDYLKINKNVPQIDAIFNHWKNAIKDANAGMFYYSK